MKLYSFEWQTSGLNGAGDWHPNMKVYKTAVRADGAFVKFKADMTAEDLHVSGRLVELVDDEKWPNQRCSFPTCVKVI